jgi:uncharacterized protein involved in exopolysaccharide biosynthesis
MKPLVSVHDYLEIILRRKLFLIVPFLLITCMSIIGAFLLPAQYESYTTILIQREEILNPLVQFQMAVTMAQGDALSSFNEILYSRSTLAALLDSLGKREDAAGPAKFEDQIEQTRKKISTSQSGSDSFRITVADDNPVVAQRSATLLAQLYIQTSQKASQQQNEEAVKFFEQKVEEYGKLFEAQQREFLNLRQGRLSSLPQGEQAMALALDRVEGDLRETQKVLEGQEQTAALLKKDEDNIDNQGTVSQIAALETQGAVQYMTELKALAIKYNQLLGLYTPRYPEVQSVRKQLLNLLRKSSEAVTAAMEAAKAHKAQLQRQRDDLLQSISRSLTLNEASDVRRSTYVMYKEMYDGMKVKLEQARVSRDLGLRGANKFVILDPAMAPTKPTKPKKQLIVGGGIGLGAIVGILAAFLSEYFDPTIRRRSDVEVYQKPIVAYLP